MTDPRTGPRREPGAVLGWDKCLTASPLRLHLGCGDVFLEGYVNMDVAVIPGTELRHDMTREALPWPDSVVDEIFMSDVFEHIHKRHHDFVIGEWLRVLKPGKTVQIIGPNFEALALSLIRDSRQIDLPDDLMRQYHGSPFEHYEAMATAILSDAYDSDEQNRTLHHWAILTGAYVAALLKRHGFERAEVAHNWPATEFSVVGVK